MNKRVFLLFSILFCVVQFVLAQPEPDAPIDGGASLLVGAGVAYGMKKIRDKKKSKKDLKDTI